MIAFVEDGTLKAKAFLLAQNLDQLEALDLDELRVFQVGLSETERRCGITFSSALRSAEAVGERLAARPEALRERKPLASLSNIDWAYADPL